MSLWLVLTHHCDISEPMAGEVASVPGCLIFHSAFSTAGKTLWLCACIVHSNIARAIASTSKVSMFHRWRWILSSRGPAKSSGAMCVAALGVPVFTIPPVPASHLKSLNLPPISLIQWIPNSISLLCLSNALGHLGTVELGIVYLWQHLYGLLAFCLWTHLNSSQEAQMKCDFPHSL